MLSMSKKDIPVHLLKFFKPRSTLAVGNEGAIPARVALALQADGWILRQDVVWKKLAPMPESVTNRCTKAHEYIFMLTKSAEYYADMEAVKEGFVDSRMGNPGKYRGALAGEEAVKSTGRHGRGVCGEGWNEDGSSNGRNKRSVWDQQDEATLARWLTEHAPELLSQYLTEQSNKGDVWILTGTGYKGAHFATFVESLVETCLKIGTSSYGSCAKCQAPYRRLSQERALSRQRPNDYVKRTGAQGTGSSCANTVAGVETRTLGWIPTCHCHGLGLISDPPRPPTPPNSSVRNPELREGGQTGGEYDAPGSTPHSNARKGKPKVPYLKQMAEYRLALAQWQVQWERLKPQYTSLPRVPCTVLDPFLGSGTSCAVALGMGLRSIGIDLSNEYLNHHAIPRIEGVLLSRPSLNHLVPKKM